MSDDDLIRRGDAMKAMGDYHWQRYASKEEGGRLSTPAVFTSHTWQSVQDIIAALPAAQPVVKVKPLVWGGDFNRFARDAWGGYVICDRAGPSEDFDWFGWAHSSRCDTDESNDDYPTIDAAKAAAQADYEARILAALDVQPAPDVAALVHAANQARLALAGYVSADSAIRKLDAALAAYEARNG